MMDPLAKRASVCRARLQGHPISKSPGRGLQFNICNSEKTSFSVRGCAGGVRAKDEGLDAHSGASLNAGQSFS